MHSSPSTSILPSLAIRSRKGVETKGNAAKGQDNASWGNSAVSLEPFLSRASRDNAQIVDDQAIVGAANTTTTTTRSLISLLPVYDKEE